MSSSVLTKRALAGSLKQLMQEKPLDKISIEDLTGYCHLSRNSFYYHFTDKYDLLSWIFYHEFVLEVQKQELKEWDLIGYICQLLYSDRVFYSNALTSEVQNSFTSYFTNVLHDFIVRYFTATFPAKEEKNFFVGYFADGTRLAITRWLTEDNQIPPEKFVALMKAAIEGLALQVVQDSHAEE